MGFANYSELQDEILDYAERPDQSSKVAGFIQLAEAKLNRELPITETDATLTGTTDSRRIDISSLSLVEPISLHIVNNGDEEKVTKRNDGNILYLETSGRPQEWGIDGTNIDFDRPCDQAYSFRFRYQERFALSDANPTNWLLTNHPDVYLAASLAWGAAYSEGFNVSAAWQVMLEKELPSIANELRQKRRGKLQVDPALQTPNRFSWSVGE